MKKMKGFTLIELLAVILILGIIALIAIPTVTNIIKESKRGAFKSSVQNIISAVETECQLEQMRGEELTISYSFTNGSVDNELNVKGDLPKNGTITVDSSCNVTISVKDGDFCATKALDSDSVLVGDIEDGECIIDEEDSEGNAGGNQQGTYTCVRAATLHTTECTQTLNYCYAAGYTSSGSKGTTTITYGNLGTTGTLSSGDAFDCDVNNDGTYDPITERFYYVSDYYNTTTKEFETDKATLIYYNNTKAGVQDNTSAGSIAYDSSNKNYQGPVTAITNLPTRVQWTNANLITGTRTILAETGATSTMGGALPTGFDYSNYAARLITAQELNSACGITIGSYNTGELDGCNYLMENTKYSSSSLGTNGYWIETPSFNDSSDVWYVYGNNRYVKYIEANYSSNRSARPAISLLKSNISY